MKRGKVGYEKQKQGPRQTRKEVKCETKREVGSGPSGEVACEPCLRVYTVEHQHKR